MFWESLTALGNIDFEKVICIFSLELGVEIFEIESTSKLFFIFSEENKIFFYSWEINSVDLLIRVVRTKYFSNKISFL